MGKRPNMSEDLKKVRKGTKSCTECRRRKVRCTWSSDDAPRCRRCEERDSNCVAQVYSLHNASSRKLTSKDRIARLEHQVTTLHKALRSEGQSNEKALAILDAPAPAPAQEASDTDDSETGSNDSSGFQGPQPSHLRTLFNNEVLSSETSKRANKVPARSKTVSDLSTAARRKLQELIPPQEDVSIIAEFATQWLSLFHALFPAPSMIKSGQDMVDQYERVKNSSVDPAVLASWLLSIAMTIHQIPKERLGPENQLKGFRNAAQFSRSVSDAVEEMIMRYDVLLGSISGIDAAMLYLRLQLSRGNFKSTWLQLRRVIAVAELIGLHRAGNRNDYIESTTEGALWGDTPQNLGARKAQVWESLCSIDRISGMLFNLPAGTRRYKVPQQANIMVSGEVSSRAYLSSLSEVAMKAQDLEDYEVTDHANGELYAQVLKLDGEMRVLASITPASWWNESQHISGQLLQYWHFYINIRVHLPFTLRHDTSEQFTFSRLACMKACQTLVQRYIKVRALLPPGFFVCRIVDLQCFTALVVLILAYYAANPAEKNNLYAQGSQPPELLVPQVLNFMRTIADDPVSGFARQAIEAVTSLSQLLDGDKASSNKDLKIKVPLLGKVHVRRKKKDAKQTSQVPSSGDYKGPTYPPYPSESRQSSAGQSNTLYTPNLSDDNMQDSPWDPLSWSIEDDQLGVFQDALMTDEFSPLGTWWDPTGSEIGQQ